MGSCLPGVSFLTRASMLNPVLVHALQTSGRWATTSRRSPSPRECEWGQGCGPAQKPCSNSTIRSLCSPAAHVPVLTEPAAWLNIRPCSPLPLQAVPAPALPAPPLAGGRRHGLQLGLSGVLLPAAAPLQAAQTRGAGGGGHQQQRLSRGMGCCRARHASTSRLVHPRVSDPIMHESPNLSIRSSSCRFALSSSSHFSLLPMLGCLQDFMLSNAQLLLHRSLPAAPCLLCATFRRLHL